MKRIGKLDLFTIALGSVIGWGAFVLPGNFFLSSAGVINTAIGFFVAVLMIAVIEKSYSKLMKKYRESGGEYIYATRIFGDKIGFITGWLLLLAYISIIPLNATAVPMVLEKIFPIYTQGTLLYHIVDYPVYLNDLLVSVSFILFFGLIQIKGISYSAKMQNLTVFSLLASVAFLLVFLSFNVGDVELNNFDSNLGEFDTGLVVRIIAFAPWAFIGFDTVAQVVGESKSSAKSASLMAIFAVIFGGLVYNALNIITAFGVNSDTLEQSSWATGDAVLNLFGSFALIIIGIAMLGAVLSGLNGFFMSSTRLTLSMVLNNRSVFNDRENLTRKVIIFISLISVVVPFFGRNALFWFVDVSSVCASFAYLVTCFAAFRIAGDMVERLLSLIGMLFSLFFLIFLLTPFFNSNIPFVSSIVLTFWLVLGFVFFAFKPKFLFARRI